MTDESDPLSVCCRHLANSQHIIEAKDAEIERLRANLATLEVQTESDYQAEIERLRLTDAEREATSRIYDLLNERSRELQAARRIEESTPSAASAGSPTAMAHKGAVYDRTGSRCNRAAYFADGNSGGSSFVDWNTWTEPVACRVYSSDSTVMQGNGAARIAAEVIRRTAAFSSPAERT